MAKDYDFDSYEEQVDYEYEDYEYDDYKDRSHKWTEEDSWDALTDGMYGEMPRSPMEYDAMMDALGF